MRATAAVSLLTLAALLLRLVGLDTMLPYQLEPDHGLVRTASWLDRPEGVVEATIWSGPTPTYPWLMPRILQAMPGSSYPEILPPSAPLEDHLESASRPFHRTRLLAALLSTLAVPLTYLLARRVMGRGSALLAAALVAASVLLQNYGQQGRAHGPMGALPVLGMLAIVSIPRSPTWRTYLAAGGATGLAVACLHTGGFLLPPLVVAHLLTKERRRVLRPLAALAVVAVFVVVFYPSVHTMVPWKREGSFSARVTEQLRTFQPIWEGLTGIPGSLAGTEPVLLVLAVLGGILAAARLLRSPRPARERLDVFVLVGVFALVYFLFWVALFPFRPRYLTSIVPFLAILAAYGAREATRSLPETLRAALAGFVLALPAWACLRLAKLRSEPDTAQQAAAWLAARAGDGSKSVALGLLLDLPVLEDRAGVEGIPDDLRSHWQRYQMRLPAPEPSPEGMGALRIRALPWKRFIKDDGRIGLEEMRAGLLAEDADFVVLGDRGPEARERDDSLLAARALYGDPVARFPPLQAGSDGGPYPAFDLGPGALSVILGVETWGFPIEIYAKSAR